MPWPTRWILQPRCTPTLPVLRPTGWAERWRNKKTKKGQSAFSALFYMPHTSQYAT